MRGVKVKNERLHSFMHTYKMNMAKPFRYSLPVTDKYSNFSNEHGKAILILTVCDYQVFELYE